MKKPPSFLKLGIRLATVFFIVVIIVKLIMTLLSTDVMNYVKSEEFLKYVIGAAVFSLIYGFLMAKYQIKKHNKK